MADSDNKKPVKKERKVMSGYRFTPYIDKMIKLKSAEEGCSTSAWVENVIMHHLAQEVSDTSVLLYHFEELKRTIKKLDTKVEEHCVLFLDFLQFFFRTQPGISETRAFLEEMKNSNETVIKFLTIHRNKLKRQQPFLYQIFGDMLEDDGEINLENKKENNKKA